MLAIMLGGFNIIEGFFALLNDRYIALADGQFYVMNRTGWGWAHILLGLVLIIVGYGILTGRAWARITGLALAILAAFVQMLYLPMYPFWALINIGLLVVVIWTLSSSRGLE
jgi:hypothetical protein